MRRDVLKIINYFLYFQYPPTFEEVAMFYPKKISKIKLQKEIDRLVKEKKIILLDKDCPDAMSHKLSACRYTLGEYRIKITNYALRITNSLKKIEKIQFYLKLLSLFPQIKLVGLSGTVAMMNAKENDDIDLFIITAKNRLWTGKFIAIVLASILRIKRLRITHYGLNAKDKVCLNLFFDEKKMDVPDYKKTEYVAHEILQMKPLINKGDIYQRFLRVNKWIYKIYPNAKRRIFNLQFTISNKFTMTQCFIENSMKIENGKLKIKFINKIAGLLEQSLKFIQLKIIKRHQTSEVITDSQLWFFPEDFEAKIKKLLLD